MREHLGDFLAAREAQGASMPRFVTDELFGFLRCGVAAHGVALFRCSACNASRLVALSCKGRGFCPRCLGRRMTELALEWTRWVLPEVRIRQWVLSLPFWLRVPLAYRHALALEVHAVAGKQIERWYRKQAKRLGVDGRTGMINVIQTLEVVRSLGWAAVSAADETFGPGGTLGHESAREVAMLQQHRVRREGAARGHAVVFELKAGGPPRAIRPPARDIRGGAGRAAGERAVRFGGLPGRARG